MTHLFRHCALGAIAAATLASGGISAPPRPAAAPAITLVAPWARPTSARAPVGAGYLIIRNTGDTPDRLLSVTTSAAADAHFHSMNVTNGIMRMRPITGGIVVPAHGTARFEPGGNHIMFIGLKRPFVLGDDVPVTLQFARAGTRAVRFKVRAPDARDGGMH